MEAPPNILVLFSDQHVHWACGFASRGNVPTPNLDMLASRGTRFSNAYCNSPACAPSRASFFTGQYGSDVDAFCNATPWKGGSPTWGTLLRQQGYHCQGTGKFDLCDQSDYGILGQGHRNGHAKNPDITSLFRCPGIYRWDERSLITGTPDDSSKETDTVERTLDFITRKAATLKRPWIHYTGFGRPHPPFKGRASYFNSIMEQGVTLPDVPDEVIRSLHPVYENLRHFKRIASPIKEADMRRARAGYFAKIRELDEDIGRILDALEASEQGNNTVVLYASDHGESLGENGLWLKGNLYDSACRVPLVFSGPGIGAGKVIETPVSLVDVSATLLDLAGISRPARFRGKSLRGLFRGGFGGPEHVVAENHTEGNCTGNFLIRCGDWKMIYFAHYEAGYLFNLAQDPGERKNLWYHPDCKATRDELHKRLCAELDPIKVNDRAFDTQGALRQKLVKEMTEKQLKNYFSRRLGAGQASNLARRMKRFQA